MSETIQTGLVGYGSSARLFHAPLIQTTPGLNIKKVVQRHADSAAQEYPEVEIVRSTEELLEDDEIELVVITTPNTSHYKLTRMALEAGRHVVVEKPFVPSSREAQDLINLAEEQGTMLSVFQNRRWDGDFLTVKKLIGSGAFGRLVEYESRYDRFRNHPKPGKAWREKDLPGSGILYDLGSHLIDQALVLFGTPERISADVRRQRDFGGSDDYFELDLFYEEGLKVTLQACMLVRERTPRFRLRGTQGTFVKYGMDPQEEALKTGKRPGGDGWGEEPEERWGSLITEVNNKRVERKVETERGCYQEFYRGMAEAILSGEPPPVRSSKEQRSVRLP